MSQRIAIFIVLVTFLALALGVDAQVGPQPPTNTTTTPETTTSTTTTPPTTTSTTTTPTTTTQTTTTQTTTTQTTTTSTTTTPTTTTTTTTIPTTTTTVGPNTTTVEPVTTPAPQPAPKPDVGKWTVYDSVHNVTCIILDMAIQLNVSYTKSSQETGYAIVNVPGNETMATGSCGNQTQTVTLTWQGKGVVDNHTITFTFEQNTTAKHFHLSHVEAVLSANVTEFPGIANATSIDLHNNQTEFSTTVGMSYRCSKIQKMNMTSGEDSNVTVATVSVSEVQLESFHNKHEGNFSAAEDCEHPNYVDVVPIAVGCALVGLVAIVLIAYLVSRRRTQARGYLSM